MDPDLRRWILEFLLMSSAPDSIIKHVWNALPLTGTDSRLAKILALRSIQSEVAASSITEISLECLEIIEEIDNLHGIPITQAMKEAYCAVAVECTVKHLDARPDKNRHGLFHDSVNRIWRDRFLKMVSAMPLGRKSQLFSADLVKWKDDIESARWDVEMCERLLKMNTRQIALDKVRIFLKETWASMGPSFLEVAASEGEGLASSSRGDKSMIPNEGRDKSVSGSALVFDEMNLCEGRLHCSNNMTEEGFVVSDGSALHDGAVCMEKATVAGGNEDGEQLGNRVVSSVGGNEALDGIDWPQKIDRAIQKGKQPLEHNHAVPSTHTRRGVKIIDAEEVGPATVCRKDHNQSNIQVEQIQKSLRSSSSELQALVKDPLPDALQKSDIVRSELATKGVNHEPPFENQSTVVNVPEQNTCQSTVPYQLINDNLKKQSSARCGNARRAHPRWMERNSTAHTYEWDDPFADLPGVSSYKRRRKVKWSSEEEDALRDGVKKFGTGNWKLILRYYGEIFEKSGRTEVHLKDKWRNLSRWS